MNPKVASDMIYLCPKPRSRGDEPDYGEGYSQVIDKTPLTRG